MKAKIITKLKEKAKSLNVNLSNVRINGLADKLASLVDKEDDIDGEIDKLDQLLGFKELAALDDAKRNADKAKAEQDDKDEKPDPAKPDAVTPPAPDKDKDKDGAMPGWFKEHVESQNKIIEGLTGQLAAFKNGQTTQTRRQQLEAKIKDAPEKFKTRILRDFDRLKIDSDDDFTGYLADIEQDVADEVQAQSDAGLGGDQPTIGIGGANKLKDDEVSPAMKAVLAERKATADAKAAQTA